MDKYFYQKQLRSTCIALTFSHRILLQSEVFRQLQIYIETNADSYDTMDRFKFCQQHSSINRWIAEEKEYDNIVESLPAPPPRPNTRHPLPPWAWDLWL